MGAPVSLGVSQDNKICLYLCLLISNAFLRSNKKNTLYGGTGILHRLHAIQCLIQLTPVHQRLNERMDHIELNFAAERGREFDFAAGGPRRASTHYHRGHYGACAVSVGTSTLRGPPILYSRVCNNAYKPIVKGNNGNNNLA